MISTRKPKNAIRLSRPASWWGSTWREALPTGNGMVGVAVYGGASNDTIMIGHGDLWWQGQVGVLQDVADKVALVRKSLDENNFKSVENVLQNALISKGYRPQLSCPLPICDFKVVQPLDRSVRDYCRTLNMENGEVSVNFRDSANKYDRSVFVSRVKDMICYEITKTGNKSLNATLSFELHDKFNARTPTSISKLPDSVNVKCENFFMYFGARSDNGTDFGAVAKITFYGGSQVVEPNSISIKGTDRIFVTIKPFVEGSREKAWKELKAELIAEKLTYDKLIKEHTAVHSKLFLSTELEFDAKDRDVHADELLRRTQAGESQLALLEKYWAFGRFLTICSTTNASLPQSPYGLWCGDFKAHNASITLDSILNCYSHCMAGNMTDMLESVFSYYENHMDDLKKNASRLYGCRGIFVPFVVAHGTGLVGSVDSSVLHFTAGGAIVAKLFWDYYLYSDDAKFLKTRALPFMKEVAVFYEEFFKVKNASLVYDSSPSCNNVAGDLYDKEQSTVKVGRNATVDFAVARELFTNLIEGSQIAGVNKMEVVKWKDMLTRIPDYQFADGMIKEYIDSKVAQDGLNPSTNLFYPVYPGQEVAQSNNLDLAKQMLQTAKRRVVSSLPFASSASLLKYAHIFARLNDQVNSFEHVHNAIKNMSMSNLIFAQYDWRGMGIGPIDTWAAFGLEANCLLTSVMQEWVLQSTKDSLSILPSLPEEIQKGSLEGALTRCGVVVDVDWDSKKGTINVKLKAKKSRDLNVVFPASVKKVKQNGNEVVDYNLHTISKLQLQAGKQISIEMKL